MAAKFKSIFYKIVHYLTNNTLFAYTIRETITMKKTIRTLQLGFLATIALASCKARFYTPNHNPTHLFREKGDLIVNGGTNLGTRLEGSMGYALTNNVAMYGGYCGSWLNSTSDSVNNEKRKYKGNLLNVGLGYFLNKSASEEFRFEIFGDLAVGTYRNSRTGNNVSPAYFNGHFTRIGIMPNFGYTSPENDFHFGYSIRLSSIKFSKTSILDSVYWNDDIARLNARPSYGMLEHAFTVRIGDENIKFETQLAFYHGLNSTEVTNAIPYFNFNIMAGLYFNINLLQRKQ